MAYCIESLQQPFYSWKFNWRRPDLNQLTCPDWITEMSWLDKGLMCLKFAIDINNAMPFSFHLKAKLAT